MSHVLETEDQIMDIKWNKIYIINWAGKSNCQWQEQHENYRAKVSYQREDKCI